MEKEEYVIVVFKSDDGEEKRIKVKKGERILLKDRRYIVAGVTKNLGPNIRFEEVPKKTFKSLILSMKKKDI